MNDDILGERLSADDRAAAIVTADKPSKRQRKLEGRNAQSKVRELGIFTTGIGIILGALCFWLYFVLSPPPGQSKSLTFYAFPLSLSILYIGLGALNLAVQSRAVIACTIVVVVIGFLIEMLIGFSIIKAVISALVIWLIVKNGSEAMAECSAEN